MNARPLARRILCCTLIAIAASSTSRAQDTIPSPQEYSHSSFGIRGGANLELLNSSFTEVPGCPQCSPVITKGTGLRGSVLGYYAYHPSNAVALSLGLGYSAVSATMSQDEATFLSIDGVSSPATINHSVDATLNRLALVPSVGYEILSHLSLNIGSELGYLLNPTFASRERLAQPSDRGFFMDTRTRTRDEYSGPLPNANRIQVALTVGLSYSLPMNTTKTLSLVPSISGSYGLTNLIPGVRWKENGMGASLAMEYRPTITPEPPQPLRKPSPPPDTVKPVPAPPRLLASITASGLDSAGVEDNRVTLRIEELYETALVPLVPYVFFGPGSSTLPERYHQLTPEASAQFSESKLPGADRLALYGELLNTLGSRLVQHPEARITVVGCADPSMPAAEVMTLAERRAQTVKDYLVRTWSIDPDRIAIKTRTLPEHPSPVSDSDGVEEDRRVEIASLDPALLAPVFTADTLRSATPPTIRFRPNVIAEAGVKSWNVTASQSGVPLKTFNGIGAPPDKLEWVVADDQTHVPRAPGTLEYRVHVEDALGQAVDTTSQLPVEQLTLRSKRRELVQTESGRAEIERYTLVLFDFNSSDLTSDVSGENARTLALIKNRITNRSSVSIRGFGDRIGDAEYNRRLADGRAHQAAKALDLSDKNILPADGTLYPYSNNLPEGRFYSRTVEITIRTPLEGSN